MTGWRRLARAGVRLQPDPGSKVGSLAVAACVLLLVGALLTEAGRAGPSADVTLNVSTYRNANGILVLAFAGTIASSAANEVVDVVGQDCGGQGSRLISGTHTRPGGGWRVENPNPDPPWGHTPWSSGITFRARWNDRLSEPYALRLDAPLNVIKVKGKGKRSWRVYTSPPGQGTVSMKGKVVQLQRLKGASWTTIARKPLVYKPRLVNGGPFNHEVVFVVKQRGWRLRAILPAKQALPCYQAGISPQWRS